MVRCFVLSARPSAMLLPSSARVCLALRPPLVESNLEATFSVAFSRLQRSAKITPTKRI